MACRIRCKCFYEEYTVKIHISNKVSGLVGVISILSVFQLLFRHTCWNRHPCLSVNTLFSQYTLLKKQMRFPMSLLKLANAGKDERALQSLVAMMLPHLTGFNFLLNIRPQQWGNMGQLYWDCNSNPIPKEPFGGWDFKNEFNPNVCVYLRKTSFPGIFHSHFHKCIEAQMLIWFKNMYIQRTFIRRRS